MRVAVRLWPATRRPPGPLPPYRTSGDPQVPRDLAPTSKDYVAQQGDRETYFPAITLVDQRRLVDQPWPFGHDHASRITSGLARSRASRLTAVTRE